jgi:hypothetical protein
MSEHHDQPCTKLRGGKLHTADLRRRHDVSRYANDEQISESLVENQLGRNPGIGTTKNNCKRLLAPNEFRTPWIDRESVAALPVRDKSGVTFAKASQRFSWGQHMNFAPDSLLNMTLL